MSGGTSAALPALWTVIGQLQLTCERRLRKEVGQEGQQEEGGKGESGAETDAADVVGNGKRVKEKGWEYGSCPGPRGLRTILSVRTAACWT